MKAFFLQCIAILVITAPSAFGQPSTGLPFDLAYSMSRQQAVEHLHLLHEYEVASGEPDTLAYVTPDPATDTKNGLFLKFSDKGLIEIASMKTGLTKSLFEKYMNSLLALALQWKTTGVETVIEDTEHNFYLYKDFRSYMTISGDLVNGGDDQRSSVSVTFAERNAHDSAKRR
jgi:hypothetical protein